MDELAARRELHADTERELLESLERHPAGDTIELELEGGRPIVLRRTDARAVLATLLSSPLTSGARTYGELPRDVLEALVGLRRELGA